MIATKLQVPSRNEVTPQNQEIFDNLQQMIGFVPNVYAYFAKNDTALADYLALQNRKSTLRAKEREVINLITSQENGCLYCQSAHTEIGKMNGFTEDQVLEIRSGRASFDAKLDALARFTRAVVAEKGRVSDEIKNAFFDAGYTEANMVDVVMVIGDKFMSNYLYALADFEIDFPVAKAL